MTNPPLDLEELKRLALQAAGPQFSSLTQQNEIELTQREAAELGAFERAATPLAVLALIAEVERLRGNQKQPPRTVERVPFVIEDAAHD